MWASNAAKGEAELPDARLLLHKSRTEPFYRSGRDWSVGLKVRQQVSDLLVCQFLKQLFRHDGNF